MTHRALGQLRGRQILFSVLAHHLLGLMAFGAGEFDVAPLMTGLTRDLAFAAVVKREVMTDQLRRDPGRRDVAGLTPDAENAGVYRRFRVTIRTGGGSPAERLCRMTVRACRARMGAIQHEHAIVVEACHVAGAVMATGAVWAELVDMRRHEPGILAGMAFGARRRAVSELAALRTRMAGHAGQRCTGEIDPVVGELEIGPSVVEGGSIAEPGRGPALGRVAGGAIALAKRVSMHIRLGVAGRTGLRRVGRGHVGCMAIGAGDLLVPALERERGRSMIKTRSLIDTVVAVGTGRAESFDMVGHKGLCAFTMALHARRRFERKRQTGVAVFAADRGIVVVDDVACER
ncbi:MAG TPA: hypothetical protein PK954_19845, partial [Anaerolineales bacterium]|nr:hypothetical protein [Anaerolineales bacterium]